MTKAKRYKRYSPEFQKIAQLAIHLLAPRFLARSPSLATAVGRRPLSTDR